MRFADLEKELGNPTVFNNQKQYRELTQEHAYLSKLKQLFELYKKTHREYLEATTLLEEESDEEFKLVLQEEIEQLANQLPKLENTLKNLLVPPNPDDHRNVVMEIRAGTGGDEAALFVADCVRMYKIFADKMKWGYETLSITESDIGGYKEYAMVLSGNNVHRYLQYESGTHRVQRVPATETQGRVHTSAITIAILMEPGDDEEIVIDEKEIRIDTMRSSGAGGQHVNTTDSAVRITHLPTGIVVYCQQEKSQHKNKDKAMRHLQAKLAESEKQKKHQERSAQRSTQIGSGDRSERIRTYNYSQNRITDHRIGFTLYSLDQVLDGDMEQIVDPLVNHFYQKQFED